MGIKNWEQFNESIFTKDKDVDIINIIKRELDDVNTKVDSFHRDTLYTYKSDTLGETITFDFHQIADYEITIGNGASTNFTNSPSGYVLKLNFITARKLYNSAKRRHKEGLEDEKRDAINNVRNNIGNRNNIDNVDDGNINNGEELFRNNTNLL